MRLALALRALVGRVPTGRGPSLAPTERTVVFLEVGLVTPCPVITIIVVVIIVPCAQARMNINRRPSWLSLHSVKNPAI